MVTFKNHNEMIACALAAGKPFTEDEVHTMMHESKVLAINNKSLKWVVVLNECGICKHTEYLVEPACNDHEDDECEKCCSMAMNEVQVPKWEPYV